MKRYVTLLACLGIFSIGVTQTVFAEAGAPTTRSMQMADFHISSGGYTNLTEQELSEIIQAQLVKDYHVFYGEFLKEIAEGFGAEAQKAKEDYELVKENPSISESDKLQKRFVQQLAQGASTGAWQVTADFPLLTKDTLQEAQAILDRYGVTDTDDNMDETLSPDQEKFILTKIKEFLVEKKERNDKYMKAKKVRDAEQMAEYEAILKDPNKSEQDILTASQRYGYSIGTGFVPDITPLLEEVEKRLAALEGHNTSTPSTGVTTSTNSTVQSSNTMPSSTSTGTSNSTSTATSVLPDQSTSSTSFSAPNQTAEGKPVATRILPRTGEKATTLAIYGMVTLTLSSLLVVIAKNRKSKKVEC
ncbi:hypothetical protein BU202_07495 [Streptococcus cuniculi]|uniref:LPXTG cell wall anchor domain-containing protein n=1 Tax=Streptococcus cuniculi TaxID=1432788 RepID=A0A1Q8E6U0_9STRE|nr:LPXTG cell wall anchor domain-containing protein [Streptococcus cuniculi]OLF47496.1 hypothetical protein BU202_07495 [Streptococcus cuniculi]